MIIGCLMIIMSCNGDNADESTKELDHSITHRHISFEEFTEKNAEAALGLGKQNEKVAKKIMQKDGAYDAENDFTILTDKIFMAENEGGAYYTFQISRENGNFQGLENLILKSDGNGGFSAILSKYTLSDQEIEAVAAGQPIENLNQKTEFKSIETIDFGGIVSSKETPCQMFLVSYCSGNNPDHVGGFNPDGTNCPLHAEGIAIVGDCGNGGIGNGPGNGNGNPGPGTGVPGDSPDGPGTTPGGTSGPGTSGGTGGPNNNPPGPPVITTPVVDQIALAKKKFMSSLTAAQEAYLNQKTGINNYTNPSRPVILAYLETNFYSLDSCEFVLATINYLILNPQPEFTPTNFPGIENGMTFEWWKDDVYIKQNFTIFEQLPNAFEIVLFNLFPDKALMHVNNSLTALNKAQELFLDGTLPGIEDGKADAFRHAYWNALDTSEFGSGLTKVFTDAHEAFSSGLPKQMDLYNNLKGREKAEIMNFDFFTNDSDISSSILIEVYIGHLVYINNGVLIPTN